MTQPAGEPIGLLAFLFLGAIYGLTKLVKWLLEKARG
jgi:hypothetical protein